MPEAVSINGLCPMQLKVIKNWQGNILTNSSHVATRRSNKAYFLSKFRYDSYTANDASENQPFRWVERRPVSLSHFMPREKNVLDSTRQKNNSSMHRATGNVVVAQFQFSRASNNQSQATRLPDVVM